MPGCCGGGDNRFEAEKEKIVENKKNSNGNEDQIRKIYIEPTSRCNLNCKMCPRNTWTNERIGDMDIPLFELLLNQAKEIKSLETIFFGGVAEPMSNRNIIPMIKMAKKSGVKVELISNGSMLDKEKIEDLLKAGLDMLWMSIDPGHSESLGIELGADGYKEAEENLLAFKYARRKYNRHAKFGIAFVAMKSNIIELPKIITLGAVMGATEIKVSNIIPYTQEMQKEMLYEKSLSYSGLYEDYLPNKRMTLNMPVMDFESIPPDVLSAVMKTGRSLKLGENMIERKSRNCKFIEDDSLFVRWDGEVCPCMALLHNNKTYLQGVEREIRHCSFGNLKEDSLKAIWDSEEYRNFRNRVRNFDFPICMNCTCDLVEKNEEDCLENPFPTCGACLWSEGFAQCP